MNTTSQGGGRYQKTLSITFFSRPVRNVQPSEDRVASTAKDRLTAGLLILNVVKLSGEYKKNLKKEKGLEKNKKQLK